MKFILRSVAAAALFGSAAQATPVDTQLQLLIDVSGSINSTEFNLQMDGYAAAFRDQTVIDNILDTDNGNRNGAMAAQVIFWSSNQTIGIDWTLLDSESDILSFANGLDNISRPGGIGNLTGIAGALSFGASEFAGNGFTGGTLVMDVSGDGTENVSSTQAVRNARDAALAVVDRINGLPILNEVATLDDYYLANVIGGAGAFVISASDFADFEDAVTRKVAFESSGTTPVPLPAAGWMAIAGVAALFGVGRKRRA